MSPELINLLVVVAGIVIVFGLGYAASKIKTTKLIDSDVLVIICDLIALVSDVGLTDTETKNIAEAIVSVIKFIQESMTDAPIEAQKARAIDMVRDLAVVSKTDTLSDEAIERIVNMAFILLKK